MEIKEIDLLLDGFDNLPQQLTAPTYLEICRYPRRRFEEICSRLLAFYFNPQNEHGLGDLFISCLLQLVSKDEIFFDKRQIRIVSEDNAEGKRIDLLIHCPEFAIGIENKISAQLYNPFETYRNRIAQYGQQNIFNVVLSLHPVTDVNELQLLNTHRFVNITYLDLFYLIKSKIGDFVNKVDAKYLIYLFDLIQTLENMDDRNILNHKLESYFSKNQNRLENLISLYEKYKQRQLEVQKQRVSDLMERLKEETNDDKWWAWQGWDLGYDNFNRSTAPRVGIESSFEAVDDNPLGRFRIYITAWSLKDWQAYESQLLKDFKGYHIDKPQNRAYLHLDVIENNDEEQIIEKLKFYYEYLKKLTVSYTTSS